MLLKTIGMRRDAALREGHEFRGTGSHSCTRRTRARRHSQSCAKAWHVAVLASARYWERYWNAWLAMRRA